MRRGPPLIKNSTEGRPYWDLKGGRNAPGGGEKRLKKKKERGEHLLERKTLVLCKGQTALALRAGFGSFYPCRASFYFLPFFSRHALFPAMGSCGGFCVMDWRGAAMGLCGWVLVVWWIFVACVVGLFYIFVLLLKAYLFSIPML